MTSIVRTTHVPVPFLVRWAARSVAAVVIITWLQLVIIEWVRHGSPDLRSFHQAAQAAALAIVFAGYLIGWRNELVGGLLSILGTLAFGVICALTFGNMLPISWTWFAAPGLLYIVAWYADYRQSKLFV
jgi:hypothetical protein